jgi:DnaJ family protein B protein 12
MYFENLELRQLKRIYKQYAIKIHPDKNSHPKAAQAFRKINKFYNIALEKKI